MTYGQENGSDQGPLSPQGFGDMPRAEKPGTSNGVTIAIVAVVVVAVIVLIGAGIFFFTRSDNSEPDIAPPEGAVTSAPGEPGVDPYAIPSEEVSPELLAQQYFDRVHPSRVHVVKMLHEESYIQPPLSPEEAEAVVDGMDLDFKAAALATAEQVVNEEGEDDLAVVRDILILNDEFTEEEADYAIEQLS